MTGSLPGTRHLSPHGSASAIKARTSAENGRKGGRPPGRLNERLGRHLAIEAAPKVAAELIRLALHAKVETVRAAACRDVLAYAWGKPAPFEGDGSLPPGGQVMIVNVVTGVRG
jgi:hypothetical protein